MSWELAAAAFLWCTGVFVLGHWRGWQDRKSWEARHGR